MPAPVPWAGSEGGPADWFSEMPRNWPHYVILTASISATVSFERTVTFPAVPEDEEADLPALAAETVTDTWNATLSGTLTWNRETSGNEVFFEYQNSPVAAGKFHLLLSITGGPAGYLPKCWNHTKSGDNDPVVGTVTKVVHDRNYAPPSAPGDPAYGEVTTLTETGDLNATWILEQVGVLQTWLGEWIWAYVRDGGSAGLAFTTEEVGLPVTIPINYDDLISPQAAPPAGAPITLSSSGLTEVDEETPGDWFGTAESELSITLSNAP